MNTVQGVWKPRYKNGMFYVKGNQKIMSMHSNEGKVTAAVKRLPFIASRTCAEPGSGSNSSGHYCSFTSDFMRPLSVSAPLLFYVFVF